MIRRRPLHGCGGAVVVRSRCGAITCSCRKVPSQIAKLVALKALRGDSHE
jgi:hypothetical protein